MGLHWQPGPGEATGRSRSYFTDGREFTNWAGGEAQTTNNQMEMQATDRSLEMPAATKQSNHPLH